MQSAHTLSVLFVAVAGAARLQSVDLDVHRDHAVAVAPPLIVEAHIGTPPTTYRLLLTSRAANATGVLHCLDEHSQTFDSATSSDVVRFTERQVVASRRTALRTRLWQRCFATDAVAATAAAVAGEPAVPFASHDALAIAQECAHGRCDGALSLDAAAPLWRAFVGFTLTRNTFALHTELPPASQRISNTLALAECGAAATEGSYCDFDARTRSGRAVTVSLVADDAALRLPHWLAGDALRMLELELGTGDVLRVDLDAIRAEQAAARHDTGVDDDDDVSRSAPLLATLDNKFEADDFVQAAAHTADSADETHIVIGTSALLECGVRRRFAPHNTVEFFRVSAREHLRWPEALMQSFFFTHFIALLCHSALVQASHANRALAKGATRAASPSPQPPLLAWLSVFSVLCTLAALLFALSALFGTRDGSYLDSARDAGLYAYVCTQVALNGAVALFFAPLARLGSRLPAHWRLLHSAASEQTVLMALLLLATAVRTSAAGDTFGALTATLLVVGNAARNLYHLHNLVLVQRRDPRRVFYALAAAQLGAVNFVYSAAVLSSTVLLPVLRSPALVALAVAVAVEFGLRIVDVYRESERTELAAEAPSPRIAIGAEIASGSPVSDARVVELLSHEAHRIATHGPS